MQPRTQGLSVRERPWVRGCCLCYRRDTPSQDGTCHNSRHILKMASNTEVQKHTAKQKGETFTWTDGEVELLLEAVKDYASECHYKGIDWESVKAKYEKITNIFIERYPKSKDGKPTNDDYPKSKSLDKFTKERVSAKLKAIRQKYKKAVDSGKRSGGGRIVMTFYDLCNEIWAGAPSTTSVEGKFSTFECSFYMQK